MSPIKSLEFITNFIQGKREKIPQKLYEPQKPKMPEIRNNPQPLERSLPEAEGVPSGWLEKFFKDMSEPEIASHCIMIARHGKVIASAGFKPYREDIWHISHSLCKSITSLAAGIAIHEGYFSIEDSLHDIFPEENRWPDAFKKNDITVRELLTMSTGVTFNELGTVTEEDWIQGFMNSFEVFDPGKGFAYNSTNTYMLSAIIQEQTGMKLLDYVNEKLFHPMGIYDLYWEESPQGANKGGWGLNLWIEDMVKLGILCLNEGCWKGQQLVPREWFEEAVRKQIDTPEEMNRYGYGYQFWMCKRPGSYQFNGMFGQNVVILPDLDMVIATTGGSRTMFPESRTMDIIMKYFGGDDCPISNYPLLPDENAYKQLKHFLEQLSFMNFGPREQRIFQKKGRFKGRWVVMRNRIPDYKRIEGDIPGRMESLLNKIYEMEENTASVIPLMLQMMHNNYSTGMKAFRFVIREAVLWLETREGTCVHRIRIGFDGPLYSEIELNGEYYKVGSRAVFREDEDGRDLLYVMLSYVETTSTEIIKFCFREEKLLVKFEERPEIEDVISGLDVLIPVRGLRALAPVKRVSDLKFARREMGRITRQKVRAEVKLQVNSGEEQL